MPVAKFGKRSNSICVLLRTFSPQRDAPFAVTKRIRCAGVLMTNFLPPLVWRPSANFSSRHGTRVDLIVLHDCEGGYEGSMRWFEMTKSNVSAHYVVREDGAEATQMVELADNAWHACSFNRRSIGVEMGGFASRGFGAPLLTAAARMFAYLCYHLQIPVRHARAGIGPGIASHNDLGVAGGGHHDPSSEPDFMQRFVAMVDDEHRKGHFPDVWDPQRLQKPCLLSPDKGSTSSPVKPKPLSLPDVHSSKYPPAKPGALGLGPLEAAEGVADAAP
jgi:N-acetylmuramoyl-L-alanine amidase